MSTRIAEVTFYEVICEECRTSRTYSTRPEAEAQATSHDALMHPTVELEDA